jgi:hypothetical protein
MDVAPKTKTTPRQKIAQLVRMLGATEHGVRVNTWSALKHTMKSLGITWTDVGNWIEGDEALQLVARTMANAGVTVSVNDVVNWIKNNGENDLRIIYETALKEGIEIGKRQATPHQASHRSNGHGAPNPRDMAAYCQQHLDDLNEWEQEFVTNMMSWTQRRPPTAKQQNRLEELYAQLGGRI